MSRSQSCNMRQHPSTALAIWRLPRVVRVHQGLGFKVSGYFFYVGYTYIYNWIIYNK